MMLINNKAIKRTGWYIIGSILSKGISSLLIPIYVLYVEVDVLGSFDYFLTICSFLTPLLFCNIWEGILRYLIVQKNQDDEERFLSTVLTYTITNIVIVFLLSFLIKKLFSVNNEYYYYYVIFASISGVFVICQSAARSLNMTILYVLSDIIKNIINILLIVFFVYMKILKAKELIISSIVSEIISIIVLLTGIKKRWLFSKTPDFYLLKKLFSYSYPLLLNNLSMLAIIEFNKIAISANLGNVSNGLYSFANKIVSIVSLIGTSISMVLFEEALNNKGNINFEKEFNSTINTIAIIMISFINILVPLISILYCIISKSNYFASIYIIPVLMINSTIISYSTNLGTLFKLINKTKYQLFTTVIGALGTCFFSYYLVRQYELKGAVIGQLIGSLMLLISRLYYLKKYYVIRMNIKEIALQLLILITVSILSLNISIQYNIYLLLSVVMFECAINKEIIMKFIKKAKAKID